MRRTLLLWAGCTLLASLLGCSTPESRPRDVATGGPRAESAGTLKRLDFEQTRRSSGVRYASRLPQQSWAPDGRHLVVGRGERSSWEEPRSGQPVEPTAPKATPPSQEGLTKTLVATTDLAPREVRRAIRRAEKSDDGEVRLIQCAGQLYCADASGAVRALAKAPEPTRHADLSPDGKWVGFIRKHNLYLAEVGTDQLRQLTTDGNEEQLYGQLDWVYQEEVYGRGRWKGFWWSPESDAVAFLALDQSNVPSFPIVDLIPMHPEVESLRYPKAGDPNPRARLGVGHTDGTVTWVDLSSYPSDVLIVRVGWTPDGSQVVLQLQDRVQTWLDLVVADPRTGSTRRWIRESTGTWTNRLDPPRWLEDGSFLWASERTGYKHLYHYDESGELLGVVTRGEWPVRRIIRVDEQSGWIWFTGATRHGVDQHAFRVRLDGSEQAQITRGRGWHSVEPNGDGSLFINEHSRLDQPPRRLLINGQGEVMRVLAESESLGEYQCSIPELHEIENRHGERLDATVIKPHDFDPRRKYPVWLITYSGPAAPSVSNRWSPSTWDQFLAQEGYIVFRVNNRSSSRYGQRVVGKCYRQLGVTELQDLEDAVRWLTANPWADGDRVGIRGWSYGGFMAAYALTHSSLFRLGFAGAGVYDWRCYDTIYTERYMGTPQDNPDGYRASSCVAAAANLSGHLVLVHGTVDDNVHVQNAMQFAQALQRAGHAFEFMLYPQSTHGIRDPEQRWHMRELEWRAIQRHIGPGSVPFVSTTP